MRKLVRHDQYHAQPAGGSTDCRIEGLQGTHTYVCVHLYTEGESFDWLKMTISNIWAADPNGQWQRRQAGSAAGGVVTCGIQKGRVWLARLQLREMLGYC